MTGSLTESRWSPHEIIRVPHEVATRAVAFSSMISRLLGRLDEARAPLSAQFPPPGQDARVLIPFLMGLATVATVRASENRQLGIGTRVRLTPEDRAFLAGAHRHRSGGSQAGRS
ncbi:hypothetical protein ACFPOI_34465 [Nonomuraea angiospora]|uniref:Uncharacterized protein n=1 Tax=Nonomuraea angiospora TaxID=46172 RepID=A0ABR9LTH4_9ACTN|nr:hypothetical protein [Nonomuraea angiospora]MBE1583949.1 hypothetical protein [Nonomuraea angiospora]